jgi:hypothetical protein
MGDIFGWWLFDFLWWVVDTIFLKCINRGFLAVNFDLFHWSSVFDHCNFFAYVRKIIIFSVCGPFYWILHNLMITSFLSLKFDWNFSCCCSKVTEKLTMELATENHSQLRAIGVLVIAFSVEVPKFICSWMRMSAFSFSFFSDFSKMFLLTITRRKVS